MNFFTRIGLYVIRSRILTFTLPVSYFTLILTFFIHIFQILHQDLNTFLYIILITLDPFCRLFLK